MNDHKAIKAIEYDALIKLTGEEITLKMKNGEIAVPPKGKDRIEFLEFTSKTPEEREAWIKSRTGSPDPEPPVKKEDGSEVVPDSKVENTPVKKEDDKPQTWWEKRGYSTEDEATTAIDSLRDFASKQKENFDRLNADRGKLGKKLIDLEKEVSELRSKKPEERKDTSRPVRPKRPKASEFDDGVLDPKYHEALGNYEDQLSSYEVGLETYLLSAKPDIENRLKKFEETIQSNETEKAKSHVDTAFDEMWKEARTAQEEFGLKTSRDLKEINEVAIVLDPKRANMYTDQERADADKLWKSYPEADRKAFVSMIEVISAQYDFSDGPPVKRFKNRDAALIEAGLIDKYKRKATTGLTPEEIAAQVERKRKSEEGFVSTPSASSMQSGDALGLPAGTDDKGRLMVLLKQYSEAVKAGSANAKAFEERPEFKELVNLRKKITGRVPDFKRYQ